MIVGELVLEGSRFFSGVEGSSFFIGLIENGFAGFFVGRDDLPMGANLFFNHIHDR